MARKKQVMGLTDNQPGAEEANRKLAEEKLAALPAQLEKDLALTGGDIGAYLRDSFGINAQSKTVEWTLASGKKVLFTEARLTYEQVKNDTVVEFEVNGRDQDFLNAQNLSDLSTMDYQQFYPTIACRKSGKISILDGSRRRGYFLSRNGKVETFTALIAEGDIEISDAKALAKSLQSAREHNLLEVGKRCDLYRQAGLKTQAEIALAMGVSRVKVVRAMQAATISNGIYQLFDDINELTVRDYSELSKINDQLAEREDRGALLDSIEGGEVEAVMLALRDAVRAPKQASPRAEVTHLVEFTDKNKYARKRVKDRDVSYEFSRLTAAQQKHIDTVIAQAMSELFSE
ncbi:chromosome partitioning protein ParB [Photobacterium japonica]|uniref:ParB family protein n=1 Tax=Photobacterium japonica TaxID=2910235 RepID=UPI003D0FE911